MRKLLILFAVMCIASLVYADIFLGHAVVCCQASAPAGFTWDAPTTYIDGSPITEPLRYRLLVGRSSGKYSIVIEADKTTAGLRLKHGGTYYCAVKAVTLAGIESDPSVELVLGVNATGVCK